MSFWQKLLAITLLVKELPFVFRGSRNYCSMYVGRNGRIRNTSINGHATECPSVIICMDTREQTRVEEIAF